MNLTERFSWGSIKIGPKYMVNWKRLILKGLSLGWWSVGCVCSSADAARADLMEGVVTYVVQSSVGCSPGEWELLQLADR